MDSATNISEIITLRFGKPSAKCIGFASTLYDAIMTKATITPMTRLFFGVSIMHLHYFFNTHITCLKINNGVTLNTNF